MKNHTENARTAGVYNGGRYISGRMRFLDGNKYKARESRFEFYSPETTVMGYSATLVFIAV